MIERGKLSDFLLGIIKKAFGIDDEETNDKPYKHHEPNVEIPQERWILNGTNNCPSCTKFSEMGWQPLGFFPAIGENATYCGEGCKCEMEYSAGAEEDYPDIERITDWQEWELWSGMVSRGTMKYTTTAEDNLMLALAFMEEPIKRTITIRRDEKTGGMRWFAWPACTAFLNRDKQIDSTMLFDNFIKHIDETQIWPFLTFFHMGSAFKIGESDFVARDGAAYLLSGLFDDSKLAKHAQKSLSEDKEGYWGLSIQYMPLGEPSYITRGEEQYPVYEDGFHIEISVLPEAAGASLFTAIPVNTTLERSMTMNSLVRSALEKLVSNDPEFRAELETMIDSVNREAQKPEAVVRETTETVKTTETIKTIPDIKSEGAGASEDPKERADPTSENAAPVTMSPDTLNEIATALLGNDAFLGVLSTRLEEIKTLNQQEEAKDKPEEPVKEAVDAIEASDEKKSDLEDVKVQMRAQSESLAVMTDALKTLTEGFLTQEAEAPRSRVRTETPDPKKPDLGDRAATVLTKMNKK